jgi:hypothetical protein
VHSLSEISYALDGSYAQFKADIGLADYIKEFGSVHFQVYTDGTKVYDSGLMTPGQMKSVEVDLRGKTQLRLVVTNGDGRGRNDHANWADARLERTCATQPTRLLADGPDEPLRLYPNPAQGTVWLELQSPYLGPVELHLVDLFGRSVQRQTVPKPYYFLRHGISVRGLPEGLYFMRIQEGPRQHLRRLTVRP